MPDSEFWKGRQAELEKYAKQYPDLEAHWNTENQVWFFCWDTTRGNGRHPDGIESEQECENLFMIVAGEAAAELPNDVEAWPRLSLHRKQYERWLDRMRVYKWGFEVTGALISYTELEWDLGVKDGKTRDQVRREHAELEKVWRTKGGELRRRCTWDHVYKRTKSGKLRRLSERELTGKTSNNLKQYFRWFEGNGVIKQVFEFSASFCRMLAYSGDTTATEAKGPAPAVPDAGPTGVAEQVWRRRMLRDCKERWKSKGLRLTDEIIGREVSPDWKSRYPIQKWAANNPEYSRYDERIRRVLSNDQAFSELLRAHKAQDRHSITVQR